MTDSARRRPDALPRRRTLQRTEIWNPSLGFFGGGGWGPVGNHENKPCLIQNAVMGFREKDSLKMRSRAGRGVCQRWPGRGGAPRAGGRNGVIYTTRRPVSRVEQVLQFWSGPFGKSQVSNVCAKIFPGPAGAGPGPEIFLPEFRVRDNPGSLRSISEKVGK